MLVHPIMGSEAMSIWVAEYFEAGSSAAYMSQTIIGAEAKDAAVVQFLRSGGDEVLKITPWGAGYLGSFTGLFRRTNRLETSFRPKNLG
jgi:hypothetical protein